ncbi:MAG: hypothetical protein ACLUUL_00080 [Gemmiger sp.]
MSARSSTGGQKTAQSLPSAIRCRKGGSLCKKAEAGTTQAEVCCMHMEVQRQAFSFSEKFRKRKHENYEHNQK